MDNRADYVDIRVNESINNIIVMKDGKIQEIRSGSDFGGSVRVLKNGSWGFGYTTQISKLDEMAESALKLAKSLTSDVELTKVEPSNDKLNLRPNYYHPQYRWMKKRKL